MLFIVSSYLRKLSQLSSFELGTETSVIRLSNVSLKRRKSVTIKLTVYCI